ncbi:MAG: GNAT family N-acetyltransferase [Chloroflexota bacterium]|nr:GNAT family N-acetyltransferase [Chloroflexota bacterium]
MFELRSFRDEDTEAVWQLHNLALDDVGAHGGRGPWEDDLRDIRATYVDSGGEFLVGLLDGELVAMGGLLRRSPDEAEVRRMRVHPDRQRRGFGRRLLERLEERACACGCRVIRLDTTAQQTAAQRLYERAGYRETGRRQIGRFLFIDYAKTLDPR